MATTAQNNPRAKFLIYGQEDPRPEDSAHKGKAIQQRGVSESPYATYQQIPEPNHSVKHRQSNDGKVGDSKTFDPAVYAQCRADNALIQEQRKMKNHMGNGVLPVGSSEPAPSDKIGAGKDFDAQVYVQSIATNAMVQSESKNRNHQGHGVFPEQAGAGNSYPTSYHAKAKAPEMPDKVGSSKTFDPDVYKESRRANVQTNQDSRMKNYVGAGGGNIFQS